MPSGTSQFDLPEQYREWAPASITLSDLFNEIENLRNIIGKSTSPVAFCHNDLQEGIASVLPYTKSSLSLTGNILLPKASSGNIRINSTPDENGANALSAFNPKEPKLVLINDFALNAQLQRIRT